MSTDFTIPVWAVQVARATLPTVAGCFEIRGFEVTVEGKDQAPKRMIALIMGDLPTGRPVLTRVFMPCLLGEAFASSRCTCGAEKEAALQRLTQEGAGILLFEEDEGLGRGLMSRLRAYQAGDAAGDISPARCSNQQGQDLRIAAAVLRQLGISQVRLMTNNPAERFVLEGAGLLVVDCVTLTPEHDTVKAHFLCPANVSLDRPQSW